MQGWISVYREILDKPIWTTSTPEQKVVLMTIMLMVNHDDNEWEFKGEKFIVKSGQMITSLESIVQKCGKGISIQNVRTSLKRFEKYGFLTNESTNKNRLITIVNYGFYQSKGEKLTSKPTSNQQATNKQLTTNNNDNNNNNENKIKNTSSSEDDFNEFWTIYPKKADKKKAFEKFKAALKKHDKETIINGTLAYVEDCKVKKTEKQYIKHATTFLNGECYLNEYDSDTIPGQADIFDFDLE